MNISLQQDSRGWVADFTDLPGSPPVGIGTTKEQAVMHLFRLALIWKGATFYERVLEAAQNEGFTLVEKS
jgi:hypothetical protein